MRTANPFEMLDHVLSDAIAAALGAIGLFFLWMIVLLLSSHLS
jgi:hypothetical protein